MRQSRAALGTTVFFFVAPGFIAGIAPWLFNHWQFFTPAWDPRPLRWLGTLLILAALAVLIECFVRFAIKGRGTPAPIMPTETLVISGLYRYVRNPMYVAVFAIVVGQGLLFGDTDTLLYAACVWIGFTLFVMLYEEPTLRRTFTNQYATYCANVHRWIPRLTPWHGGP